MLAPSILSADFTNIREDFKVMNEEACNFIHVDIMDGNYVPNISFGPSIVRQLRKLTDISFDTHLMIEKPENYIKEFAEAGCNIITIHPSTTKHLDRTLSLIKSCGMKCGIAINPSDDLQGLKYIINDLYLVLIMSVNPGFGGQSFIEKSLDKIRDLRKIIDSNSYRTLIEVDGGVKLDNAKRILNAGADILVSGSGIFNGNVRENIKKFKELMIWKRLY